MPRIVYVLGLLVVTYAVTRIWRRVLPRRQQRSTPWLVKIYLASVATFVVLLLWLRGPDPLVGIPYVGALAFWFAVDWLRRYRTPSGARFRNPLHRPGAGRWILGTMVVAAVAYLGMKLVTFTYEAITYPDIEMAGSQAEALYANGTPALVRDGDDEPFRRGEPLGREQWLYRTPATLVRFEPGSLRVASVYCGTTSRQVASCRPTLGTSVGMSEPELLARLGNPSETAVAGGRKVMRYPELGHDYLLEQFRVRGIRVYPDNNDRLAKLWQLIRYLIP
jgi:hypothetical protein